MDIDLAFFDSAGGLWVTCDASHPEARAFGPCGTAREPSVEEVIQAGWPGCHYSAWDRLADDRLDGWIRPALT